MYAGSTTLSYLAVLGRLAGGVLGKRDLRCWFYHAPLHLLRWRLGWKDRCCCWLSLDVLAFSRMVCSVAVSGVILQAVPDLRRRKNQAWKEVATHPPLLAGPAGPAGAAQEEHLLLQRNASAVGLHHITFARLRESVYTWSQNVRRLDDSLLQYSLWPAGRGVQRKDALEQLLQKRQLRFPVLEATQTSQVLMIKIFFSTKIHFFPTSI